MTREAERPRAVVLLSGGLDSATVLAIAADRGFDPHALSFRYGQRHHREIDAARAVTRRAKVSRHLVVDIDAEVLAASALTGSGDIPKDRSEAEMGEGGVPATYVPARNALFLAYALSWAEGIGARDIFIGVNAVDYSGYPDCRPQFIAAFEAMANLATKAGSEGERITVHAPLIAMTKGEIVAAGLALGVDYALTTSCYDPAADGAACGRCDACRLRLKGFAEAGVVDPIGYVPL